MAPLRKTCPSSAQRLFQTGTPRCRSRCRSVPADRAARAPPIVTARPRGRELAATVVLLLTGFEAFAFIALVIVALIAIGALAFVFLKADDRHRDRT